MKRRTYLDNAATTCADKSVVEAMLPYLTTQYGNPSSLHGFGTEAKAVLERARAEIALAIGASTAPGIIFTSGGTESNNLALKGTAFANRDRGNHIIVSSIEHDCILNTCEWLRGQGFRISYIPVDENAVVDVPALKEMITPATILVSVMYANNETGTIQPIREIGAICREAGIPFHSDACQAFGKIPLNVEDDMIDLLTINSHKIYGPKGVGALYIRKGLKADPLLHGGGQEGGMRSTTENIPGIAGFVKAAQLCMHDLRAESARQLQLKNSLVQFLSEAYDTFYLNGDPVNCLPGHVNFSFHGLEGETIRLLLLLDEMGIAVSAGSACSSNNSNHSASHVLQAIGRNQFEARGAIRVSLGRFTTQEDIDWFRNSLSVAIGSLNRIFSS
jgi:cysteine desulfurase